MVSLARGSSTLPLKSGLPEREAACHCGFTLLYICRFSCGCNDDILRVRDPIYPRAQIFRNEADGQHGAVIAHNRRNIVHDRPAENSRCRNRSLAHTIDGYQTVLIDRSNRINGRSPDSPAKQVVVIVAIPSKVSLCTTESWKSQQVNTRFLQFVTLSASVLPLIVTLSSVNPST